jgi:hypothetical protein
LDHISIKNHVYHCTAYGNEILKSGSLKCQFSQHGNSNAVWAAETFNDALVHCKNAERHHAAYAANNFVAHVFTIKSGSQQRALFFRRPQGLCTNPFFEDHHYWVSQDQFAGKDVPIEGDGVEVLEIDLRQVFSADIIRKMGQKKARK